MVRPLSRTGPLLQLGLLAALLVLAQLASGCGSAHHVRPLGKGNHAVHASIGGPVTGVGSPDTPLPLTTLTYKTGLTDRADFFVGWHVLETFVNNGNVFFDIGASYYLMDQNKARPGLSAALTVSPLINRSSAWLAIDLQVTASWALGPQERHLLYVGFHNTLTPVRSPVVPTAVYSFSPYIGGQLRVGPRKQLGLTLELKWLRPYLDTEPFILGYLGPGNQGALSFMSGITVYIPGKRERERQREREEAAEQAAATTSNTEEVLR